METCVLLPIKPRFAWRIFSRVKRYEFRKTLFRSKSVHRIVVYASSPVSKVIGHFEIESILELEKERLWSQTKDFAGISREYFNKYFEGRDKGFAISIGKTTLYHQPLDLKRDFGIHYAPQSFIYLRKLQKFAA